MQRHRQAQKKPHGGGFGYWAQKWAQCQASNVTASITSHASTSSVRLAGSAAAQALRSLAFAWASVLRAASNARDAVPCWGCSNCGTRLAIAIRASRARFHANAAAATASSCAVCFIGFFRDSTAAEPLPHSCACAAVPLGDSSAPAAIAAGRLSQAGHVSGGVGCDCLAAFQRQDVRPLRSFARLRFFL